MKVYVNGISVEVLPGMRVRHALMNAGLLNRDPITITDEWGNEVGLDGALHEEMKIFVKL